MTDFFFLFVRLNLPDVLIRIAKKFNSDFPSPCFDVPKTWNFTSGWVQKTGDREWMWRHFRQASRKTDFYDIFLFSYKHRTFVSLLGQLISSQSENEIALAEAARAISASKTHSCKSTPNWTRNRMITDTNWTAVENANFWNLNQAIDHKLLRFIGW